MQEKEINKILKPKKKLIVLLFIYLSIAFLFIGVVFFMRFANKAEEVFDLSELVSSGNEKEGQYVTVDIDSLPILMEATSGKDNRFYYVTDVSNHIYIASLTDRTFTNIVETMNAETGKLNSTYQIKGITNKIDEQVKNLALTTSYRVFKNKELNSDNFSEYLGEFYVKDNLVSERVVTLYTVSVLFGVFFLILALGYILPGILQTRKVSKDKELLDELRRELKELADTPYKEQHLYLTKNYIVSGIQVIKYEDIVWGYILQESKYGMKVGENLIVHTKDNKKHIISSVVGTKNHVLDNILADIKSRNADMRVGYNKENEERI